MQNELVVVVPVSQHKSCEVGPCQKWALLERHLCLECCIPRILSQEEDYFYAFDLPRKFRCDASLLEQRFFELSKRLHPDRFVMHSAGVKERVLVRMSFINQAYTTLSRPVLLREYFFTLYGLLKDSIKTELPEELVEVWFDLQDSVDLTALASFLKRLEQASHDLKQGLILLQEEFDRQESLTLLEKIAHQVRQNTYLETLIQTVTEKMRTMQR